MSGRVRRFLGRLLNRGPKRPNLGKAPMEMKPGERDARGFTSQDIINQRLEAAKKLAAERRGLPRGRSANTTAEKASDRLQH